MSADPERTAPDTSDGAGPGPSAGVDPGGGAGDSVGPGDSVGACGGGSVLTFGETMVALRGSGPLKLGGTMNVSIAGAESNVAIGLARLGHTVRWVGAVGDDEVGDLVLRTLRAEAVDVSGAWKDAGAPTGLILFEPRLPDLTRVHYYRTGSAGSRLTPGILDRAFATAVPRVLHLTGITPALIPTARAASMHSLRLARDHGTLVCLDVNHRARLWSADQASAVLQDWMPYVNLLIASADELPLCLPPGSPTDTGARARTLLSAGVQEVAVKLGSAGATSYARPSHPGAPAGSTSCTPSTEAPSDAQDAGGDSLYQPAVAVQAVDAVGAGDAFVAGYLSALLDGEGIAGRLERGVTTGAFAVASPGDWEGAPTRAELNLLGAPPGTVVR
ncbi:ribokinase [Streptomyces chrestomyceticus JCM 4735]|uniref:Ribokinase n=2 Tax=Streptomyces chrestomyceticus TaxID=68185 RepID=A0A7U9L1K9_9ACTN|nr:sugar kinase [Streptomyces chrestomyceticus]GCD37911.1 ribokinase [Streptomyces chrestomyceticus JCM 4735]